MSSKSEALAPSLGERDWERLSGAASLEEFAAAWLSVAGAALAADRGVLVVRRPDSDRFAPIAFYPEGEPCGPFLADAAERALYDARALSIEDGPRLGIASPVRARGRLEAIAAFEWRRAPEGPREALMRGVQWGLPWIEARLAGAAQPPVASPKEHAGTLQRVLAARSLADAARIAATELAHRFESSRAAVGCAQGKRVVLAAISDTAQFDPRLELARSLEALMAEVRRGGKTLERKDAQGEGATLCVVAGESVFFFERAMPFDEADARRIESDCALLAPALALHQASSLPIHRRLAAQLRAGAERWLGPTAGARRILAAVALVALVALLFARAEFRVAGDAALEGSVRRLMTAPFDGYVATSVARAGDVVKAGAPIAALDDRDLRLERIRWASQGAQYGRQLQEAAAKHERGQMQILQAQLDQAEAQVQLLDEQLRRARLAAPFDGLIVSGDLSQSVGGAVKKGDTLFEVTPLSGYRVVVQVDESEIAAVAAGQKGAVLLASITGQSFPITVTSVTPVARAKEGRNTFRVEAALEGPVERLRPGMEGVAKIEAGPRNVVWIWTHRFTNWLRLKLWSLWP
ncbi:MAG TPA: HlyD family efflux transporter periplasmic adaptor subunit [Burkholderiales bacterium]|nr:HlyD family efflux transporter periplasmic adaptor subunit [Burkholderiales bacterium]